MLEAREALFQDMIEDAAIAETGGSKVLDTLEDATIAETGDNKDLDVPVDVTIAETGADYFTSTTIRPQRARRPQDHEPPHAAGGRGG